MAELLIREYYSHSKLKITSFTKWCPAENGNKNFKQAEEAVDLALSRMGQTKLDLMQCMLLDPHSLSQIVNVSADTNPDHAWDYADDSYIHNLAHLTTLQRQGKIDHIGLTNVDAAHLELLLDSGFRIATNQVSCSVIDRRYVRGRLSTVCSGRGVKVMAYGALLGGYLSERWLGQTEPQNQTALNWSLRKYLRFINVAGGWAVYQAVLEALSTVAKRHNVSIAAVAIRHVLDFPAIGAVIVGSRLTKESNKYIVSNLAAFSFQLSDNDRSLIAKAQDCLSDLPGDCGDEYRRPPYLTATGDLSHHLEQSELDTKIAKAVAEGLRIEYSSGSKWEPLAVNIWSSVYMLLC